MTQANYALRLQASLKAEAERLAKAEGTTLNRARDCFAVLAMTPISFRLRDHQVAV